MTNLTQQEIEEGNKLIAEFEGMVYTNDDPKAYPQGYMFSKELGAITVSDLQYHESWDWLMPVVEKIGDITIPAGLVSEPWPTDVHYGINKTCTMFSIGDNSLFISDSGIQKNGVENIKEWKNTKETTLTRTWLAVVAFIKWHNSINP